MKHAVNKQEHYLTLSVWVHVNLSMCKKHIATHLTQSQNVHSSNRKHVLHLDTDVLSSLTPYLTLRLRPEQLFTGVSKTSAFRGSVCVYFSCTVSSLTISGTGWKPQNSELCTALFTALTDTQEMKECKLRPPPAVCLSVSDSSDPYWQDDAPMNGAHSEVLLLSFFSTLISKNKYILWPISSNVRKKEKLN